MTRVSPLRRIADARAAAADHELSTAAAHLLLIIASHADEEGRSYAKVETLARESRRGTTKVYAALKELKDAGLVGNRRRRRGPAEWQLLTPPKTSTPAEVKTAQDLHPPEDPDLHPSGDPDLHPSGDRKENPHQEPPPRTFPPSPPKGGRQRERAQVEARRTAFAEEHFPGIPLGLVASQADLLRARGTDPTADALRPKLERWTGATA